jgi:hypothetical protein
LNHLPKYELNSLLRIIGIDLRPSHLSKIYEKR